MDYGLPKVTTGGAALSDTGLTTGQQIAYCIAALILVLMLALAVRAFWRRHKKLGDK